MADGSPFSQRFGFRPAQAVHRFEEAPEPLRAFVIDAFRRYYVPLLSARDAWIMISTVLGQVLQPLDEEWRLWDRLPREIGNCQWFHVYDILERIFAELSAGSYQARDAAM